MDEHTTVRDKRGLIVKLCEVMAEAGYIQKRGHNDKFNYDYATEADVVDMLRDKLAARNVFVFPSVIQAERKEHSKTSTGSTMFITDIVVKWMFVDGDTGESQECLMPGCGTDTGDKGIYKAITGSSKYMFLKGFMLPTGDDPENEKVDPKEAKAAQKEVAKQTLGQKAASPDPKIREIAKEGLSALETITMTEYKDVYLELSGAVPMIMANLDNKTKGAIGFRWEGNKPMIGLAHGHEFQDLCRQHQIGTVWMGAPTDSPLAPEKASIPTMEEFVDSIDPEASTDPIILSVERITPRKPGGKEFLKVNWGGKQASCFNKALWPHLEHYVNQPAMLKLEVKGQYTNLVGIERLAGEDFEQERV